MFVPNKSFAMILMSDITSPALTNARNRLIIDTVKAKYGDVQQSMKNKSSESQSMARQQTAWAVFSGPSIVFGGITARYRIDTMLRNAFGNEDAQELLSLAWYLASEGDALSNSDVWLSLYETPAGRIITSQEVTRLLDRINQDGIMTFYKEWLKNMERTGDKVLYDLTSISWYGQGINMAGWGHNRDNESLPQVNYALICARSTGMPLFAWPLEGSVSDVRTLQNTMQFLKKLDYKPDCIMMDRGFGSEENITFMLKQRYIFLQALKVNSLWIRNIIDTGNEARLRPDSIVKAGDRTYYASTSLCQWVVLSRINKKGETVMESIVYLCKESKRERYECKDKETIVAQYPCTVHVLFCQDLVGGQWDKFMEKLNEEYERLRNDENSEPSNELKRYFIIGRKKWARKRCVEFNMEKIAKHRNKYVGYVCFITNDKTILTAKDALNEYSTRDYIEKDFDELKNELDMNRIRVHTDSRMKARLFIQFIAEIFIREIRVRLREHEDCRRMTRTQIASHIKGIYKIKFKGKYKDVCPELSKSQRSILEALGFSDSR
jgi:transposase